MTQLEICSTKCFQTVRWYPNFVVAKRSVPILLPSALLLTYKLSCYPKLVANGYVLLFNESRNSDLQLKQLDIHNWFWEASQVSSHFYTSEFLGNADADNLHEKLIDCCATIGKQGPLQISMDGPNVNWKPMIYFPQLLRRKFI